MVTTAKNNSRPTVNVMLARRAVAHAVRLEQLKTGEVRAAMTLLNRRVLPDLAIQINERLSRIALGELKLGYRDYRLQSLQEAIKGILESGMRSVSDMLRGRLEQIAVSETQIEIAALKGAITVPFDFIAPSPAVVRAIVTEQPFQGRILFDWFSDLSRKYQVEIPRQINIGLVEGESIPQLIRRVRGTADAAFGDGTDAEIRRDVQAVVRTAVGTVSNSAREATYDANSDVITGVQWIATLDPRTCFPAGTRVLTRNGYIAIEKVQVGCEVLTSKGRFRRVLSAFSKQYSGSMATVNVGGASVMATANHLFLAEENGRRVWREAGRLRSGSSIVCLSENVREQPNQSWMEPSFKGIRSNSDYAKALSDKSDVSTDVFRPDAIMPVRPIYLQSGSSFGQEEINRVSSDLMLLNELDAQTSEALSDIAFRSGFSRMASMATERAKSAISQKLIRACAKFLAALDADDLVRWTATLLRAIGTIFSSGAKSLSTSLAQNVQSLLASARQRAVAVPGGVTPWNRELASTSYAGLRGSVDSMCEVASAGTERSGRRCGAEKLFAAVSTFCLLAWRTVRRMLALPFIVARRRAEFSDSGSKQLSANGTFSFHSINIMGHYPRFQSNLTVFDLEVEEDHNFIANGFVVHNCTECMARDGEVYDVSEGPRPPLHFNCRCTTAPVLKGWKEMGINLRELDAGTRASMDGQVSETMTYGGWLKTQSADVQNEALGPTRGQMFRSGDVAIDRFVDDRGRFLTLDQLRRREGI